MPSGAAPIVWIAIIVAAAIVAVVLWAACAISGRCDDD